MEVNGNVEISGNTVIDNSLTVGDKLTVNGVDLPPFYTQATTARVKGVSFGYSPANACEIWFYTADNEKICLYFTKNSIGWWSSTENTGANYITV